jgi:hypothetical protein
MTHCFQKCVWKEVSGPSFLSVGRSGFRNPIDLRRVFFVLRKYFDTHFWKQCFIPGLLEILV